MSPLLSKKEGGYFFLARVHTDFTAIKTAAGAAKATM